MLSGDPDQFQAALAYDQREVDEELQLIALVRRQTGRILRTCDPEDLQRTGVHSTDGAMTLEALLERIIAHIPHHIAFISQKRQLLNA